MTVPTIPCLAHEIQINHLDEAIAKFVNGEIDYIVCTGVRDDERENLFQITRNHSDTTNYTTVLFRGFGKRRGLAGIITCDDVKDTLLLYIDAFEGAHGLRSHEQPEKMFIYICGRSPQNSKMVA
jgi:hypothetical protein